MCVCVVACSQAWISYNTTAGNVCNHSVVACSQAWISYNIAAVHYTGRHVVACSQAWISYNQHWSQAIPPELWLALRHGLVTIPHS